MPRGRPRKSVGVHKQNGTFIPCRHEDRLAESPGKLVRPRGLDKNERWLWDKVVAGLPKECFGVIDEVALRQACRMYAKLETLKDVETPREWNVYLNTLKQMQQILCRFGWTPADRANLKAPNTKQASEDDRFFGMTG